MRPTTPTATTTIVCRPQPDRDQGHPCGRPPSNQVDHIGRTGAVGTSPAASLEEGRTTATEAAIANAVGEPKTPRRIAPVAAVTHAAGETTTPLGAAPVTKKEGPATTTNGAGEHGSLHATVEETRGRDFMTPGAAPATGRAHPATNEAVHTFLNAKVTPRRHPNGTDAPTPTMAFDRNRSVPGASEGRFTAPEKPTTASVMPSCQPGRTAGEPTRLRG